MQFGVFKQGGLHM